MNLTTNLSGIKGVGPKTAELLAGAGLETVGDLIDFLPNRYEDFSQTVEIANLRPGKVTILARCEQIETRFVRRGMRVTTATLADDTGKVQAVWFNQPYRATQLKSGQFYFSGEFGLSRDRYQLSNPFVEAVKEITVQTGRVLPIYPLRKGLKPSQTRKILDELRPLIAMMPETLPPEIVKREKLASRADALMGLHFPENKDDADAACERLAFEELFELLLAARLNKLENSKLNGYEIPFSQKEIADFVAKLPFEMTGAQKRALWEILQDFEKLSPMNRLLQGDVGSGKTIVAGAAAYQASLAGFQTAFMAPTEILANQHAETLAKLLEPLQVSVVLLTGSVKGAARKKLYEQIENGAAAVVVGTHALFQDAVKFHRLGFVVIDEQHRFGVKQRQQLLAKSAKMPHLLSMTATPIPRSLQLTVFGDLDISILNEMPRGRKPIETKIWSPNSRAQLYEKIENEIAKGRQAYVICPLIETGVDEKKSVQDEFKKIAKTFAKRRVGILHGKMPSDAKDEVMTQFAKREIDILVATTVVEVGVDVPNATVMLIENADQFGLSQLHQLRGRVGRGEHQSYCFLMMSDSKKPSQRLKEIEKSNDGFYLSEVDLKLRGPGEIYGHAQHGALNLQIANLADTKLIKRASDEADWFIKSGQDMVKYPQLAAHVAKYQRLTTLN